MSTHKKIPKNAQPFDSLNETWWLSEVTPALRRLFASTIRARARQQLIDDRPLLSPEAYEEEKDTLQARIESGAYEWGPPVELNGTGAGKAIYAVLNSVEGKIQLIQLLLVESHGELDQNKVAEIISGNPEALAAALRAAQGLPPLAVAPANETPGTTQANEKTTESPTAVAS